MNKPNPAATGGHGAEKHIAYLMFDDDAHGLPFKAEYDTKAEIDAYLHGIDEALGHDDCTHLQNIDAETFERIVAVCERSECVPLFISRHGQMSAEAFMAELREVEIGAGLRAAFE